MPPAIADLRIVMVDVRRYLVALFPDLRVLFPGQGATDPWRGYEPSKW